MTQIDKLSDEDLAILEAQVSLNIEFDFTELRGVSPESVAKAIVELRDFRACRYKDADDNK